MPKQEPGTDLVIAGGESNFLALRMDQNEVLDMIEETLGGETLQPQDLDRVKVPSGGGTTWEVPTLDGDEATKVIEGVIVDAVTRRAYWSKPYDGSNESPECFSNDGKVGTGDPGGICNGCPFNEFESAANGVGKACKETRQVFVLLEDSLIPIVVTVPPASLTNLKQYRLRLLRGQRSLLSQTTKITLSKEKNSTGIEYSEVVFARGRDLDPEAVAQMKAYQAMLKPAVDAIGVHRDEVEG